MKIQNILDDFADGLLLLHLVEILSSKTIKNYHRKPSSRAQYVENVSAVLNFLLGDGLKNIRNISAEGTCTSIFIFFFLSVTNTLFVLILFFSFYLSRYYRR